VNAAHGKTVRDANEALMFHGTSFRAIPLICELGFNRSFCGQHGTALGKGVYFAQQARYGLGCAAVAMQMQCNANAMLVPATRPTQRTRRLMRVCRTCSTVEWQWGSTLRAPAAW